MSGKILSHYPLVQIKVKILRSSPILHHCAHTHMHLCKAAFLYIIMLLIHHRGSINHSAPCCTWPVLMPSLSHIAVCHGPLRHIQTRQDKMHRPRAFALETLKGGLACQPATPKGTMRVWIRYEKSMTKCQYVRTWDENGLQTHTHIHIQF